jgi:hypothetical protein
MQDASIKNARWNIFAGVGGVFARTAFPSISVLMDFQSANGYAP